MSQLILDACAGRELELAQRYCGLSDTIRPDKEHHQSCPVCREGKDRFYFTDKLRKFFCRQCGFGGNIINLMMTVNDLTYRKAIELLADDLGVVLPKWKKDGRRRMADSSRMAWERNTNGERLTIAALVLTHLRFLPATDGIDFKAADVETTMRYATRLTKHSIAKIVEMVANGKYQGDRQKAWLALDCLYTGKDVNSTMTDLNWRRMFQEIRQESLKERLELEKTIEYHLGVRATLKRIRGSNEN